MGSADQGGEDSDQVLRQGICGRVDKGHDRPERGPWFVNFGETIEKSFKFHLSDPWLV